MNLPLGIPQDEVDKKIVQVGIARSLPPGDVLGRDVLLEHIVPLHLEGKGPCLGQDIAQLQPASSRLHRGKDRPTRPSPSSSSQCFAERRSLRIPQNKTGLKRGTVGRNHQEEGMVGRNLRPSRQKQPRSTMGRATLIRVFMYPLLEMIFILSVYNDPSLKRLTRPASESGRQRE